MKRRNFIKYLNIAATSLIGAGFVYQRKMIVKADRKKSRPNVILIITDDQGYGDLSCHGNPILKTPNLDKLHDHSIRLTNFHVDPTCSPTRASLLTGRYSSRVGVWHTIMGRSLLRRDEITIADIFRQNGYRTGIFGKWHLGDNYPYRPENRGFEEVLIFGGGAIGNTPDYWGNDYFDDFYYHNGKWEKYAGYCTDIFFNSAIDFINQSKKEPFFIYLATNTPHWPHNVHEKYIEPYSNLVPPVRASFYGMINNIDENIGRLLEFLKINSLLDNTVIIFLTDNGTSFGGEFDENGFLRSGYNAGMRGHKGSIYEGGHRVPCFICWPGNKLYRARNIDLPAAHIDILPTLIDICGLKLQHDILFDGISLKPFLERETRDWPRRTLFVHNQRVDHPKKWKDFVVIDGDWRLVNGNELYNIKEDPEQRNNISDRHPEITKRLCKDYEQWWEDISARFGEYCPIAICSNKETEVRLTSHDIHGQVAWDQRHVLNNARCDGFWVIEIFEDALYRVGLRRWPKELDMPICDAPEGGKIFKPTLARLKIENFDSIKPINQYDKEISFQVNLKKGITWMQAWFINDKENGETNGVFYVYINRLR